jgi:hypothetical protein
VNKLVTHSRLASPRLALVLAVLIVWRSLALPTGYAAPDGYNFLLASPHIIG